MEALKQHAMNTSALVDAVLKSTGSPEDVRREIIAARAARITQRAFEEIIHENQLELFDLAGNARPDDAEAAAIR